MTPMVMSELYPEERSDEGSSARPAAEMATCAADRTEDPSFRSGLEPRERLIDRRGDATGQFDRLQSVLAGHQRPIARPHAIDERFELRAQRFFLLDFDLDRLDGAAVEPKAVHFLLFRIDGDVRLGAEEAHLAHALLRVAAGGEIGQRDFG